MTRLGMILLAGVALGSTAVATRIGLFELQPFAFVGLRLLLAVLAFLAVLRLGHTSLPREPRTWGDLAVLGLLTVVPLSLFTLSLRWISAGVLSLFLALIPALTAAYSQRWLVSERITLKRAVGLGIALLGVGLIVVTRTSGLATPSAAASLTGQALALGGTLIAGYGGVFTRLRFATTPAVLVAGGQTLFGLLAILPLMAVSGAPVWAEVTWRGWTAVAWSATVGSFGAFWLLVVVTQRFGATASALPGYVMPLVSAVLGALLLGEQVTAPHLVSAAGILLGVALAGGS